MRIFAVVPWRRASSDSGLSRTVFLRFRWLFSGNIRVRQCVICMAIHSPSSACQWSQNAWPWMTLNGYFALNSVFAPVWLAETVRLRETIAWKLTKIVLSSVQIFGRDSCFWQYKVCADIRSGSLERRRERTVGLRVNARPKHLFLAFENNWVKVNTGRPICH